jgi:hypothetical protein
VKFELQTTNQASLKLCRDKRARNSGYHLIIITGIDYADMAAIPNERGEK